MNPDTLAPDNLARRWGRPPPLDPVTWRWTIHLVGDWNAEQHIVIEGPHLGTVSLENGWLHILEERGRPTRVRSVPAHRVISVLRERA